MMLFDFTTLENVDDWMEISDTVRVPGKSKAVITLIKAVTFQWAVFFSLLNPQPNGAGFAGIRTQTELNLSNYTNINIKCRGQGNNSYYKIVLRHNGLHSNEDITYEEFFTVPINQDEFTEISLLLKNFQPYYRGRPMPDADPLNTSNITMFGLQVFGGVYMPIKQKGASALEIQRITASS